MRAKEELPECPVATAVSLIGGKWKLLILRNLKERPWRFNELQRRDRKSTRLNSSHVSESRMPSSA